MISQLNSMFVLKLGWLLENYSASFYRASWLLMSVALYTPRTHANSIVTAGRAAGNISRAVDLHPYFK